MYYHVNSTLLLIVRLGKGCVIYYFYKMDLAEKLASILKILIGLRPFRNLGTSDCYDACFNEGAFPTGRGGPRSTFR